MKTLKELSSLQGVSAIISALAEAIFPRLNVKDKVGRRRVLAFSLVEVMIAMGIVSFSFLTLMGLMGVGAANFRDANTTSITTQIAQRVINEALQANFTDLVTPPGGSAPSSAAFVKPVRYFDDQGNEIVDVSEEKNAIYQVNTRITPATILPQSAATTVSNSYVATVSVQVANNPGGAALVPETTAPLQLLWSASSNNSVSTFSTVVAQDN